MKKKKKREREERPESAKLHNEAINKNIDEVETEKKKKRADHLPAVSPHLISNHKMYTCDRRSV